MISLLTLLLALPPADCLAGMAAPSYARRELCTAVMSLHVARDGRAARLAISAAGGSRDPEVRMRCVRVLRVAKKCPNCGGWGWWGNPNFPTDCTPCRGSGIWLPPER